LDGTTETTMSVFVVADYALCSFGTLAGAIIERNLPMTNTWLRCQRPSNR
jgi:hypothetical protein